MTNHSEPTGPAENSDFTARKALDGRAGHDTQVTLRTPAELADALPYLLGYRPEDSIVLVALHDRDGRGRFGGRARLGIPANRDDWGAAARQLAQGLVTGGERRGARPEQIVAYVCQEPAKGESGREVMLRLQPLAQLLRTECGALDVPVIEALCISDGRFWSYCCPSKVCCPDDGSPMGLPGTSVLAAAATYAGLHVRGTLRELRARLLPWETSAALAQETALDTAGMALVPRILDDTARAEVAQETLVLAEHALGRFAAVTPVSGMVPADLRDDDLLTHDEAARLILGLQDRTTRDRAAAWMEGDEAAPALRLWRALARRCVGPYGEHAAAPLTLAGWVAWSTGDDLEAREALAMALGADPDYLFARLLHQACNEGLDPEAIRRCLRAGRDETAHTEATEATEAPTGTDRVNSVDQADQADQPGQTDQADRTSRTGHADQPDRCDQTDRKTSSSQGSDSQGPEESSPRRRRRVRIRGGADDDVRPVRAKARRPVAASSHPPRAGGSTRPGVPAPGGPHTRAAGRSDGRRGPASTGGTRSTSDGPEGDS
ncbi:DUF4192 family protein [Streptomyces sp. NPDC056161]|uniref:DUF4192 domain-containing protein n=1 Tax=Streptomyces sp. NPDC056161 TaxID=3345732 RepID=UPI0035DEA9F8